MKRNLQDVMNEALQSHQKGQLKNAEKGYLLVLEHAPEFAPALHYLGVIGLQTNHVKEAVPLLRRASQLSPKDAAVQTNYGIALLQSEDYQEAVLILTKASKISPGNPQILANLGNAHKQLLQYTQAIDCYEKALSIDNKLVEVARNLAICYGALFNYDKALKHIRYATELSPNAIEVQITLANILLKTDQPLDAIKIYTSLLDKLQDTSIVKANLALGYAAINQLNKAKEIAEQVTVEFPKFLDGWLNFISILQEQGHFNKAESIAREALQQFPKNISLLCLITRGKKFKDPQDVDIQQMLDCAAQPSNTPAESIKLHFAIGKAFENTANYDDAFKHYQQANNLITGLTNYKIDNDLKSMQNIQDGFNARRIKKLQELAPISHLPEDFRPIFLVGMPRSGSTLTEQILASHPKVSGAGELPFLARQIADTVGLQNSMDCTSNLENISAEIIYNLRQQYFEYIQSLNLETPCFTDKMLMNFLHVGLIKVLFPDSPIIHCSRDPIDTCVSIFKLDFSRNGHHYASSQEDLAQFYQGYEKLMNHWHDVFPNGVFESNYESLISEQQKQTEALLEFCSLPWNDNCLKFYESGRRVSTLSVAQVRQPIYQSSMKKYLHYKEHIKPLLDSFKNVNLR